MIALIREHTLTDTSKVYDIEIEEAGVTMVSIPCPSREAAEALLESFSAYTDVKVRI